jgi:CheY-like chemotaxis protein
VSHLHGALLRELAHALTVALGSVLGSSRSPQAVRAAIDTAQVLGLSGLERLLHALLPHAAHPWPSAALPALDRMRSLATECVATASIVPIQRADAELGALAESLAVLTGEPQVTEEVAGEVPTLNLAEVLEDLPLADNASRERVQRVRVTAPVAAALRAALDWLEEEGAAPRPLRLSAEESVVDVIASHVNPAGLKAAEKVLSVVGGVLFPASMLGPSIAPAGSWVVRVPSVRGLHSHLMLIQGGVPLALPWHSVLRLYMVPSVELEGGMMGLGSPVLPPVRPLAKSRGEHPVVLVGSGLKRAYLVADHLVWRLEAEPCAVETAPPAPVLTRAVATEDGEVYWVLDPAVALATVESATVVPASRARTTVPVDLPVLRRDEVEPLDAAPDGEPVALTATLDASPAEAGAESEPGESQSALSIAPAAEAEAVVENAGHEGPADIEPVEVTRAAPLPAPASITPLPIPQAAPRAPERPPSRPSVQRRALIAEDSIAARVFLTRMLEREGFAVRAVITATELFDELHDDSWALLCIDVDLPDSRNDDVLEGVVATLGDRVERMPIVALVRDAADVAATRVAGGTRKPLKPFDRESLLEILTSLGLSAKDER